MTVDIIIVIVLIGFFLGFSATMFLGWSTAKRELKDELKKTEDELKKIRESRHERGTAIDINPMENPYEGGRNRKRIKKWKGEQ